MTPFEQTLLNSIIEFRLEVARLKEKIEAMNIAIEAKTEAISDKVQLLPDAVLTLQEASRMYNMSYAKLYNACKSGDIEHIRENKLFKITLRQMQNYQQRITQKKAAN